MKKLFVIFATFFALFYSIASFAAVELTSADIKRINKDVASMSTFMNLSERDAQTISDLKKQLTLNNREAVAQFGRGTPEFKKARKKIMRAYQKELYQVITREQLREYRQSKAGK